MSPARSGEVKLKHMCVLTVEEAEALLAECGETGLPNFFSSGARTRIGTAVWSLFKEKDLVNSTGVGKGTVAAPVAGAFDRVHFVVVKDRGAKSHRWKDLPAEAQVPREPGSWIGHLRDEVAKKKDLPAAAPRVEAAAPPIAAPLDVVPAPVAGPLDEARGALPALTALRDRLEQARQAGWAEFWDLVEARPELAAMRARLAAEKDGLAAIDRVLALLKPPA